MNEGQRKSDPSGETGEQIRPKIRSSDPLRLIVINHSSLSRDRAEDKAYLRISLALHRKLPGRPGIAPLNMEISTLLLGRTFNP